MSTERPHGELSPSEKYCVRYQDESRTQAKVGAMQKFGFVAGLALISTFARTEDVIASPVDPFTGLHSVNPPVQVAGNGQCTPEQNLQMVNDMKQGGMDSFKPFARNPQHDNAHYRNTFAHCDTTYSDVYIAIETREKVEAGQVIVNPSQKELVEAQTPAWTVDGAVQERVQRGLEREARVEADLNFIKKVGVGLVAVSGLSVAGILALAAKRAHGGVKDRPPLSPGGYLNTTEDPRLTALRTRENALNFHQEATAAAREQTDRWRQSVQTMEAQRDVPVGVFRDFEITDREGNIHIERQQLVGTPAEILDLERQIQEAIEDQGGSVVIGLTSFTAESQSDT